MLPVRRAGVEPAKPGGGWVTATGACQCPTDACFSSTGGSRTHKPRRFELRRFASLRTAPCEASPVGFEPTISTVTGWRALRATLRGRVESGFYFRVVAIPALRLLAWPLVHHIGAVAANVKVFGRSLNVLQEPPTLAVASALDVALQGSQESFLVSHIG